MFGFDLSTAASLVILAAQPVSCPKHDATKINIVPRTEKVKHDYSQTLKQIQSYSMDTVDPYGFHGTTVTQGFMMGKIELRHKISLGQMVNKRAGFACLWYHEINVDLLIDPTIVIAKELAQDRCMRNAILEHEMKHVKVDRRIVNDYARSFGKKLTKELRARGFSSGPVAIEKVEYTGQRMQRVVQQILEHEYKRLNLDRQDKQSEVDTLHEYKRVDKKCPRFQARKQALYKELLE